MVGLVRKINKKQFKLLAKTKGYMVEMLAKTVNSSNS